MAGKSVVATLQLIFYALLPPQKSAAAPPDDAELRRLAPRELLGGMDRFLDGRGEFRVVFIGCLPVAAPFVLFRLKREGYSRCSARSSAEGLYLQGRR